MLQKLGTIQPGAIGSNHDLLIEKRLYFPYVLDGQRFDQIHFDSNKFKDAAPLSIRVLERSQNYQRESTDCNFPQNILFQREEKTVARSKFQMFFRSGSSQLLQCKTHVSSPKNTNNLEKNTQKISEILSIHFGWLIIQRWI